MRLLRTGRIKVKKADSESRGLLLRRGKFKRVAWCIEVVSTPDKLVHIGFNKYI